MSSAAEHWHKCRHNWLISFPDLVWINPGPVKKCRHILFFIFAREQKCINNHFGWAFEGEMVVTNNTFDLEKFLINIFPPNDFLNSL